MTTRRASDLTRLVLPVPEVASEVPGAHLTLMDPFLPGPDIDAGVLAELRDLFAGVMPFQYVLGEPVRFPDGEAYLPPQPGSAFRRLMQDLRRTFPEVVAPADGLHGSIPHVPLPDDVDDALAARLGTPLEAYAREAVLLRGRGQDETPVAVFAFGTSAA